MARALSDPLIIAIIESATRLASGRGPIAGSAPAVAGEGVTAVEPQSDAAPAGSSAPAIAPAEPAPASEHDTRTAEQIAADFKTIYTQIETLVRSSAEQDSPRVGFGAR
jgi:hypothetical protein